MPSKKSKPATRVNRHRAQPKSAQVQSSHSVIFFPLLILCVTVWFIYRALFQFPVWFDESVGKALFFGLPVWLYVSVSGSRKIVDTFAVSRFKKGLLLGIAFGGIFGFIAALIALVKTSQQVQAALLFSSDAFWWEFLLSLLTGFWETLFFFSWIMVVIQDLYRNWSLAKQVVLVATIFTIFHVPNSFLRFSGPEIFSQLIILFFFAIGQAFLFARRQNGYALVLSHAIWGMVLLVHLN